VAQTPAVPARPRRGGGVLAAARRVLAGLFALSWLVFPGFGVIDLGVTWDPTWSQVLEAGWGLFMTVIVAVPFVAIAASSRAIGVASTQLFVGAAALALAAAFTQEWRLALLTLLLVVETLIVAGLPKRPQLARPAWMMFAFAVAACPAWIAYAASVWPVELQRQGGADLTLDIDHLSVQGALAVAIAALALLASFWPAGRLLAGASAGVSALYLGIVSYGWPHSPAALSPAASALCALWGLAIAILAVALRPRTLRVTEQESAAPSR